MLRLKMAVAGMSRARVATLMLMAAGVLTTGAVEAQAQAKLGSGAPVTYANKWEGYIGANFMNFQAGQALPKRMNMVGGEGLATYWVTPRFGAAANIRGEYGTTPVLANPYVNRPEVSMIMGMLGAQMRGPKNQLVAIDYHALFGVASGTFDTDTKQIPAQYLNVGLYTNRTKPIAALGGSIDFNRSKKLAIRLSPDLMLEHFGTETREFFAISGGVVYRFGKK